MIYDINLDGKRRDTIESMGHTNGHTLVEQIHRIELNGSDTEIDSVMSNKVLTNSFDEKHHQF